MAWEVPNLNLNSGQRLGTGWADGILAARNDKMERKRADQVLLGREEAIRSATNPDGTFNAQKAAQILLGKGDLQGGQVLARQAESEADNQWRRERAGVEDSFKRQSLDIQRQGLANRSRTPEEQANDRATLAGQYGLDPNSPEGRSFILTGNLPPNRQARVPVGIQNAEAGDLEAVQGLTTMNSELNRFKGLIEGGKLPLSGAGNVISRGQNFLGLSDEGSRNFASFSSTLEKLRNESLRLNKGVQTEGDSERAWNELIANINDPEVVKQRIDEITRLNGIAAEFKQNLIRQRREDNNLQPLDMGRMISRPPAQGGGAQSGPARIDSPEQYQSLPPGSQYVAPDGTVRTKR